MEEIKYNFICISLIVLTFSNLLRISSSSSTVNREENVAFFGVTSQSTQFDIQSNSSLAVDNDLTTCSRTLDEKGANWTVWLNRTVVISRIKIRTGGTFFGPNFELHIGIGNNFDDSILCNFGSVTAPRDEHVIGCFGGPMTGNFLMVKNTFGGGVKLCDLKVIVCNDGFFGIECVGRCQCDEDAVCRKEDGRCPGLCAAGWNGTNCQSECSKGRFGLNCQKTCHCHNGSPCHFQTGTCPGNRCSQNWFGQSCQTAMPQLLTPPTLYSAGFSDITVVWHSWSSYVDPDVVLSYRVEYKLIDYSGDHDWQEGALVPDTFEFNQKATISDLQHNSFYDFRVIPVLLTSNGTMVAGGASPKSSTSFRTKCTAPETPNITSVHSWIDFNRRTPHAVVSIAWTPLTNLQSNCENILYYEILYQKRASSTPWIKMGTHRTESGKNITNVLFDTEYLVRLVAHNNYPMESSSEVVRVVTQPAPAVTKVVQAASANETGIIVGSIVACLVLLLMLIFILIFVRMKMSKYSRTKDYPTLIPPPLVQISTNPNYIKSSSEVDVGQTYVRHSPTVPRMRNTPKLLKKHFPIKVEVLEDYITRRQDNQCEMIREEFMEIPADNENATTNVAKRFENQLKNRYKDILPYDHARVILNAKSGFQLSSDYINASYIDGYKQPKAYIATQGCNELTVDDFWKMIWQESCHRIVMVTNLIEKGEVKCHPYWSNTEGEKKMFDGISVTLTDVVRTADFVIRTFDIGFGSEVRNLKQFHYTAMPDRGVPTRLSPIVAFRRKVRSCDVTHPGPIVVHCSAGVGRSGLFIALDYLLDQAEAEGQIDVFNVTLNMRKQRSNMIQTSKQYNFVYNALLEALKTGNTLVPCAQFKSYNEQMRAVDPTTGKSPLQEQFELLESMTAKNSSENCLCGLQPENQDKNRFSTFLPDDKHRPYLTSRVEGTNDYINAIFLDGYRSRNAYLITQMPLPQTVIDFWRMIFENKCSTIVMLNSWNDDDETYGQYWPEENEECECGPFLIEAISTSRNPTNDITTRKLKLCFYAEVSMNSSMSSHFDTTSRTINLFQLGFSESETDKSSMPSQLSLVALTDLVEQSQKKSGNNPIVIHCRDGVTQSGLFATIGCIWERMKDEHEVDIFQTVKHLRFYKREIIRDLQQYQFCFDMVLMYLAEFAAYSNFR